MGRRKESDTAKATSYRLSLEAKMLIDEIGNAYGLNQTRVLEQAIRRWARQDAIYVSEETKKEYGLVGGVEVVQAEAG